MAPSTEPTRPRPLSRLEALSAYRRAPAPASVDLHLDGNEGSGPDPALCGQLRRLDIDLLRSYPSTAPLERALAVRHAVELSQVLVTAGGDEALDRVFRAFAEPGRNVVLPTPSFEMLPRYAALVGCATREVKWPDGAFPVAAALDRVDASTAAIFVVSPNNPTGAVADAEALSRLAAAAPQALLVLDHAYAEFGDQDLTGAALALPNAVVIRTMSKAWGLAGLRIGYALGASTWIESLRKAGSPYTVPGPSIALALAALETGAARVAVFVARVRDERRALTDLLAARGFAVPRSQGNFVLARGPGAAALWEGLRARGIAVRRFAERRGLEDALRITCPGEDRAFARLTAALDALLPNPSDEVEP